MACEAYSSHICEYGAISPNTSLGSYGKSWCVAYGERQSTTMSEQLSTAVSGAETLATAPTLILDLSDVLVRARTYTVTDLYSYGTVNSHLAWVCVQWGAL